MSDAPKPVEPAKPSGPTLTEFLTGTPLLEVRTVQAKVNYAAGENPYVDLPGLSIHCSHPACGGVRFFDPSRDKLSFYQFRPRTWSDHTLYYRCRHCGQTQKTYAVRVRAESNLAPTIDIQKFGEIPAFGEPRPNAVKDVLDDEILFFERGYRAETAGLGIGAFAYYRRFVESHKDRIIAEIRKVAVAQGAKQDVLDTLDKASKMNSFENAVKTVKDAIPDSLRHTGGHNPLTLLHDALSAGLHNEDDEQCLELAKDIRLLLTDLAERTTQALKNNSELSQAVSRLLKKATARATESSER